MRHDVFEPAMYDIDGERLRRGRRVTQLGAVLLDSVRIDGTVLAFAAAITLLTTLA